MARSSKKKEAETGNGGAEPQAQQPQAQQPQAQPQQPLLNVLAQYMKDLSFENPNAPNSLRPREKSPEININVNVNSKAMADDSYEVELQIDGKATADQEVVFAVELNYAGIFRLQGIPKEAVQAALLIECPRIMFPFARQIISESTRNGGFPPLLIDPIDFARLYQSRLADQAQPKAVG